ncbi:MULTISPECIES: LacI family DNA-binding transcriptional regulator [unclassified Microbacterium]|uniref:LacI family DNA-binding transcriptional regulator n=1 Tax=unclassified Microbacterium TaxID=2609290 RepID=UPI003864862C
MTEAQPRDAKRPTMMEVARLAGVSHQTVSRYLRAEGGLRPATRESIDRAVNELNYRPNLVARSMRTRRTGRLAVVLPRMTYDPARMVAGAAAAAAEAGFGIEVVSVGGAAERTQRALELADSGQVEGVLSLSPLAGSSSAAHTAVPVVVSDDFDEEMRGVSALADASPVVELVAGLAAQGHTRFAHVAGAPQFASARARADTFTRAVQEAGLEVTAVYEGDWSGESGIRAVRAMDERHRPTAVIAANDVVAAGVIRGAWERGWTVPGDLSVTGWDNHVLGQFGVPSLTTVDVDLEGLGRNAMRRLIAAVRSNAPSGEPEPLLTGVVWRESTAPPSIG